MALFTVLFSDPHSAYDMVHTVQTSSGQQAEPSAQGWLAGWLKWLSGSVAKWVAGWLVVWVGADWMGFGPFRWIIRLGVYTHGLGTAAASC